MRECKQLKRALGVPSASRGLGAATTMTGTVANILTIVTVDLIGEITVIAGPILATITEIDVIIATTTAAMTGVTTTVAMTATTDETTT
jgi:hypothetical protein